MTEFKNTPEKESKPLVENIFKMFSSPHRNKMHITDDRRTAIEEYVCEFLKERDIK